MSFSDTTENSILLLIFNAVAWANWADNASASPEVNIGVALHTGDPGEAGNQSTNEAAYTSYTRINIARTSSGWTVTANSVSPAANINFPEATGGSEVETHWSVAKASSNVLLGSGTLTPNVVVSAGVAPVITTGSTIILD